MGLACGHYLRVGPHFRGVGSRGELSSHAGLERESMWVVPAAAVLGVFPQTPLPTLTLNFYVKALLWRAKACCGAAGQVALTGTDSDPLSISSQFALSFVYLTYM